MTATVVAGGGEAFSTAHSAPFSIAVVHPWMSNPLSRAAKNTTSKPLLAP
jgi:hypothetical protein